MLSKLQSYLAGKAFSYFLNAEADAKDAIALIKKAKTTKTSQRIQLIKKNNLNFTLAAYSLYYHNGFTDHVYARAIAKLAGYSLPKSTQYPNLKLKFSDFFIPWIEVFFRHPKYLAIFCRHHSLSKKTFTKKDIIQTTIQMQHINIHINNQTIQAFRNNQNHNKVDQIKIASLSLSHPTLFINSAISTQKSAIFWDKMYIRSLNLLIRQFRS